MLQTYSSESQAFHDGGSLNLGLGHYLKIFRRRALFFVVCFGVVLFLGAFVTAIQKPIYEARGKVLVESQDIPTDLVKPTITDTASERIQVIQQRIMTRDNLLALMNKYKMFAAEQGSMSATDLLDLMRERTKFELVDIKPSANPLMAFRPKTDDNTIAFTVAFDYEDPRIAQRVASDLLTLILNEDARNRTTRAEATTVFLSRESERLQGQLAAIEAQISEIKSRSRDQASGSDTGDSATKLQITDLAKLKEELAQKSTIYADSHPHIIALKKKIAAMEKLIAGTPGQAKAASENGLSELKRQSLEIQKALEDNNKKLAAARLGERLERDQQSERLAVIEQPLLPQDPIKPNRVKLLAAAFALAMAFGFGAVIVAESLDASIRHSHELYGVADGRKIVTIPHITTRSETLRRRGRMSVVVGVIVVGLFGGVVVYLFFGPPIDLSRVFNQLWFSRLTHLSK